MLKTQISIQIWKLFTRFQCHLLPVKSAMLSLSNEYWLCYNSLMWLCTFRFICMISLSLLSTVSLGHIYLSCWGSAQTVSNCCSNCCHKREAEEHKVCPSTCHVAISLPHHRLFAYNWTLVNFFLVSASFEISLLLLSPYLSIDLKWAA